MELTGFLSGAKEFISSILAVLIFLSSSFGIVNPPVEPFVPENIVEEVDNSPKMTLIDTGASAYVIVKGAAASPSENTAALKLRAYLQQISGVELPIVTDAAPAAEKEIIVGRTNREGAGYTVDRAALGDEGFIIKTVGAKLVIAGGEKRGTLYGVFDFLEKFLDCAWLSADTTIVPEKATVCIPAAIDEYETPAFMFRQPSLCKPETTFSADYALANKANGIAYSVESEELGGMLPYYMGHNAALIMPESVYFADHPEYYALNEDGVRTTENPCMSNPAVIKIFTDYAVDLVTNNPGLQCFQISLNDSGEYCRCDACEAIYAEEGGVTTGTLVRMLNAIADQVAAINPECKIITLAYACSVDATITPVRDNIIVYFCPISMCYAHPLETDTYDESVKLRKQFDDWSKICKNIFIFEYPVIYDMYPHPYPIWDAMQPNIQYYLKNGATGLYVDSNASCDANFLCMTSWLYAKLLWDPYEDMDALMSRFMRLYFGDGWQYIKEYTRMISVECNGKTIAGIQTHMKCFDLNQPGLMAMTKNQITYCDELWAKAKSLAKEDWQLNNLRSCEISWRSWKACHFYGEFSRFQAPSVWTASNQKLFEDLTSLGLTQFDPGNDYVTLEEFDKLDLKYLYPQYWTWRQLGKDMQGKADNLGDIIWGWITDIEI
ncbi:MAG TPA: DUF4838 domain-containing protein [Clostridiales bacterium]|nr:MAG: hypothetical protein BWY37_01287 [Firmicutes bacterium ADurb.Bin262]HQH63544.1 DUF4838 domain-containing protein [Clostridiales bacterium]HQK72205.1 DUF4838 domain-containing protein [Clostridiales bacterium]